MARRTEGAPQQGDSHEKSPHGSLADVALSQQTGFLLIKLGELVLQTAEQTLVPLGLRARHFNILTMIGAGTGMSQRELGSLLGIDKTLVVAAIDELEGLDLARRVRDATDRRRYTLELTAKGKRVLKESYSVLERAEKELLSPLSKAESLTLRDIATKVLTPRWPVRKSIER